MNRIIKFRAWNKITERIYQWQEIENSSDNYLFENFDGLENSGYILMQFTGLTDKNGKEIYEGDILQKLFYEQPDNTIGSRPYGKSFEVVWTERKTACPDCMSEGVGFEDVVSNSIVIGNIYENPELL